MAKEKSRILKYIAVIFLVIIVLNFLLLYSGKFAKENNNQEKIFVINESSIRMKIPAVDSEGKGVSTYLNVVVEKGSGRTLVDIENLLFWADTQQSIRMARFVAKNFTNNSLDNYNLIYSVEANASLIGGPSAGAALTIATIFALNKKKPKEDVMITGTINHDGSIGPVSGILEKAKASKDAGASLFLVPLLQSRDVVYETRQYCQKFGFSEICTTENVPKKIDVSKEAGISVIEVSSIEEALEYFS